MGKVYLFAKGAAICANKGGHSRDGIFYEGDPVMVLPLQCGKRTLGKKRFLHYGVIGKIQKSSGECSVTLISEKKRITVDLFDIVHLIPHNRDRKKRKEGFQRRDEYLNRYEDECFNESNF